MMRTTPRRRIILHFSQRFRTDGRTFMTMASTTTGLLLVQPDDSPTVDIIYWQLDRHPVARHDANRSLPHLAADVGQHHMPVLKFHLKPSVGQFLNYTAENAKHPQMLLLRRRLLVYLPAPLT